VSDHIILETERLRIVPWQADQVDELFSLHSDPLVARFYDIAGAPWSMEKCRERIDGWIADFEQHGLGKHRLESRADGRLLGRAGFSLHARTGEPELGYGLFSQAWGKGYATEIALGLRDWFFATRPEDYFIAFAHRDNTASRRVLEKIGMQPTYAAIFADMPHQFYDLKRPAP
jgi:RimJ/RimL family protein N-acetyltransferase